MDLERSPISRSEWSMPLHRASLESLTPMEDERSPSMTPNERNWLYLRRVTAISLLVFLLAVWKLQVYQRQAKRLSRSSASGIIYPQFPLSEGRRTSWECICSTKYIPVDTAIQVFLLSLWGITRTNLSSLPRVTSTSRTVWKLQTTLSDRS